MNQLKTNSIKPITGSFDPRVFLIALCLLILFPQWSLRADTQQGLPVVSLHSVLTEVTKTNPTILEALEYYQSVVAEKTIATSEYYPTIGTKLTAGPEHTEQAEQDNDNDVSTDLTTATAELYVRQNIFNGGKTSAFVDETDARILAAAYEVLNVANTVYLETTEAYLGVVKAAELLNIAEQNALTQEKIMRQVREKTEAGFNRVSELYNSEARLALSKGNYISRQQDLNQATAHFHHQFGRLLSPEQFVKPVLHYQAPTQLTDTVETAFKSHPALKVAQYNIQTKKYAINKSKAAYFPTLDLELKGKYSNDTNGDEGSNTQAGAYLTIKYDFFDGGLRAGQKARDQSSLRKEQQRIYIERRNVNETVRLAWNIMVAEKSKATYLNEHVLLSEKTLNAFKEEYYVGRRTLLDLLNMENEYTDAKLAQADSHFSYLASVYRIMQATGALLAEYDTGLKEMINLAADSSEDMAGDEDTLANRDNDFFDDNYDQCDNSVKNSAADISDCANDYIGEIGYPKETELQLSPYILPQNATEPLSTPKQSKHAGNLTRKSSPAQIETELRLDVKPDSDSVTDQSMAQLKHITDILNTQPQSRVTIEGYTASDSNSIENINLSKRRANTVRQYMINHGINSERITVIGQGNANPLASNNTPSGRKMNRRIMITLSNTD